MKGKINLLSLIFMLCLVGVVSATTINVPGDHSTIQAAIDAAIAGDTINVAAGTYQEILNLGSKTLTIDGAGVDTTIIDASALSGYAISNFGADTTIKNLKLFGTNHYGFKVSHVNGITFENIKVENSGKTGIDLNTVNGATLTNIEVINTAGGFGLMILDSNNVVVTDITTSGNAWGGVSVQTKNAVSDNIDFLGTFNVAELNPLLFEKDPTEYYDITNVEIPSQFQYVVYDFRAPDNYKQWYYFETLDAAKIVAQNFADSEDPIYSDMAIYNVAEDNYYVIEGMLIQDAINVASVGDTINVAAGTYDELLTINVDSLTLLGAQADFDPRPMNGGRSGAESIIQKTYTTGSPDVEPIRIEADNVIINGFTISPHYEADVVNLNNDLVWQQDENNWVGTTIRYNILTATGNDIVNNCDELVQLKRVTNAVIEYNYGYHSEESESGGNAFSISNSADSVIQNNEAHLCGDFQYEKFGGAIYTYTSSDINVIGNKIVGGGGITFGGSRNTHDLIYRNTGGTIQDNIIVDSDFGLEIFAENAVTVLGNDVANVDFFALSIIGTDVIVSDNNLYNSGTGILIEDETVIPFTTSGISINENKIYGNTDGLENLATAEVDATENWWDAVNPDFDNIVSGNVEYSPWYIDEAMTTLNEEVTSCSPGDTETDTYGINEGECQSRIEVRTCKTDGSWDVWVETQAYIGPDTEVCTGGLDEDCDGYIDADDTDCSITTDYYTRTDLVSTADTKGAGLIGFFKEVFTSPWGGVTNVQNALNWLYDNTLKSDASFDGDVAGAYNDLQIQPGVVGETELADNAVDTAAIQDGAVTDAKVKNDITVENYLPLTGGILAGDLSISEGTGAIELGTIDPYGRTQIWNYETDSVLRLGSWGPDGDPQSVSSEGIVVYGPGVSDEAFSPQHAGYARIKSNRIGLYSIEQVGGNYLEKYYFRVDKNELYLKDDAGIKTFNVDRQTGDLTLTGTVDGVDVSQLKSDFDQEVTDITADVYAEELRATTAENTLTTNLNTEITDRGNADTTLQDNINTEASTRDTKDTILQSQIDGNAGDILTNEDDIYDLYDEIEDEAFTRDEEDSNLQNQITLNDGYISTLQNNLAQETTDRIADVDTEEGRALAAESILTTNLNTETTNRQNEDTNLQTQITSLETSALKNTDGLDIYLTQGWNTFKLPWFVLTGTAQNTIVADDLAGNYLVANVLASIEGSYNYIAYYDGTTWRVYSTAENEVITNDFTEFPHDPTDGDYNFYIYMTMGDRLTIG